MLSLILMKIEIDQSGRTEYTAVNTVLADSLGNFIVINAKDKRKVQALFRQREKPRLFMIKLFSLLISYLIAKTYQKENIYILDIEYPGHNINITHNIIRFCSKLKIPLTKDQIRFGLIGKKSNAHITAYLTFKKRKKARPAKLKEIVENLFPKKMDRVLVNA